MGTLVRGITIRRGYVLGPGDHGVVVARVERARSSLSIWTIRFGYVLLGTGSCRLFDKDAVEVKDACFVPIFDHIISLLLVFCVFAFCGSLQVLRYTFEL